MDTPLVKGLYMQGRPRGINPWQPPKIQFIYVLKSLSKQIFMKFAPLTERMDAFLKKELGYICMEGIIFLAFEKYSLDSLCFLIFAPFVPPFPAILF